MSETDTSLPAQESPYDDLTDEDVILRCHEGDERAMEHMLNRYKNFVRSKARSYFLVGADHEDIVQEGMIGLYKAVRDYRQDRDASFRTFAALCIDRQISHAIEASLREKNQPLNSYVSLTDEEWEAAFSRRKADPEMIVMGEERREEVLRTVRSALSDLEKTVLEYAIAGLDYREIARKLGRTEKSVDNALQRARRKAKSALYSSPENGVK